MDENESSVVLSGEDYPEEIASSTGSTVDPETIQEIISLSVGNYVVVEFLVGTQNIVRREGVLAAVGVSWLLLYDEQNGTSTVCDMYSVKFVTYFDPGRRPDQRGNAGANGNGGPGYAQNRGNRGRGR